MDLSNALPAVASNANAGDQPHLFGQLLVTPLSELRTWGTDGAELLSHLRAAEPFVIAPASSDGPGQSLDTRSLNVSAQDFVARPRFIEWRVRLADQPDRVRSEGILLTVDDLWVHAAQAESVLLPWVRDRVHADAVSLLEGRLAEEEAAWGVQYPAIDGYVSKREREGARNVAWWTLLLEASSRGAQADLRALCAVYRDAARWRVVAHGFRSGWQEAATVRSARLWARWEFPVAPTGQLLVAEDEESIVGRTTGRLISTEVCAEHVFHREMSPTEEALLLALRCCPIQQKA